MPDLDPIKAKVAEVALRKMLQADKYFSISTVDDLLKMLNIPADAEIYSILRPLHCIHWSNMDDELRQTVVVLLAALFRGAAMPAFTGAITHETLGKKSIARH